MFCGIRPFLPGEHDLACLNHFFVRIRGSVAQGGDPVGHVAVRYAKAPDHLADSRVITAVPQLVDPHRANAERVGG